MPKGRKNSMKQQIMKLCTGECQSRSTCICTELDQHSRVHNPNIFYIYFVKISKTLISKYPDFTMVTSLAEPEQL